MSKPSGFQFCGNIPRRGIIGSYGSSLFNFVRTWHTVFHSGFTILPSHQQCTEVPNSSCLHQLLSFSFFPFFNSNHPNVCEVVSPCGFDLRFLSD